MDRITLDLLTQNHITQRQIDRLVSRGVNEDTVLYTLANSSHKCNTYAF